MKRLYIILILGLVSLSIFSQNNEYYYYYKGEKKFLELNPNFIYISTLNQINLDDKLGKGYKISLNEVPNQLKKNDNSKDYYWAEIELNDKEKMDIQKYKEIINQINMDKSIEVASPYFKTKEFKKIGLSKYFYVKIKSLSDTLLLKNYSEKHNTIIVEQDNFMPLWFLLSCTKEATKNALEVANIFHESGLFQTAEPDLMTKIDYNCVNDTYFSNQWGLRNSGQYNGTSGIDIKACDAWSLSTGRNITIAIIDQGVELNHPDLHANIHELSFDTENGSSPSVVRGEHGTACAGIFGSIRNNNTGISGVAPECRIMSISSTVLVNQATSMRLGNGINWAVAHGADVISNSWFNIQSNILDDAITNALSTGRNGLGCIVVFATGNENTNISYPANSNPSILAVGAISPCGQRKSPSSCDGENWGSNFGTQLDVVAPGVLIPTTDRQNNLGYNPYIAIHTNNGGNKVTSDYSNKDYTVWFNGTSAACPHVAGVAALILSVRPDLSGIEVRNIIEQTAQKVGGYSYTTTTGRSNGTWNDQMGYGLVNAYAAVNAILPTISGPSELCNNQSGTFSTNLPLTSISWYANGLTPSYGSNSQFTASPVMYAGVGYVRANVTVGGNVFTLQKDLTLNGYVPIDGPDVAYLSQKKAYFTIDASSGMQWRINGVAVTPSIPNRLMVSLNTYYPGNVLITCTVTTPCGTFEASKSLEIINDYEFLMYPNPAIDLLTVSLAAPAKTEDNAGIAQAIPETVEPYSIQLWNERSGLVKTVETDKSSVQIPLKGLPKGLYYIHVIRDKNTVKKQILWIK